MKAVTNIILLCMIVPFVSIAQRVDSSTVDKKKLQALVVGSSVSYAGTLVALNTVWYQDHERRSFHFFNDLPEWKQLDKAGHFFSSFYFSYGTARALRWTKLPARKSDVIGALTGFAVMIPIEIFDGFSAAYGASAGDLLVNAAGPSFYLIQSYWWNEPRISPKFSFQRTEYAPLRKDVLGNGYLEEMIKDYNGHTYWFSIDMDKFIPFPKWLNVALGYGGHEMVFARDEQNNAQNYYPYRQYYLSLDLDLTAFRGKSKVLNSLIFFGNMIKIPLPAVEFSSKGTRLHAFYF